MTYPQVKLPKRPMNTDSVEGIKKDTPRSGENNNKDLKDEQPQTV